MVKVADKDTFAILINDVQIRIRLNGIDAPESGQAYGKKAKDFAVYTLAGKEVSVVPHGVDRYGRTIGDIFLSEASELNKGGTWFNELIVKTGLAWHYKQYSDNVKLANAERTARELKLGLWSDPGPVAPWDYRHKN